MCERFSDCGRLDAALGLVVATVCGVPYPSINRSMRGDSGSFSDTTFGA